MTETVIQPPGGNTATALNKTVLFRDMGRIAYKEAWDYQTELFQQVIAEKLANRKRAAEEQHPTPNFLLFCEHNPVFTLGKSGDISHLLSPPEMLQRIGFDFYPINRGGDITYHGPGQLTGYPVIDLGNFFTDIGKYLRFMEDAIILVLEEYGLKGERYDGLTGVWLDVDDPQKARKICAIGVHTSRWVTMHGFGFNINTQLEHFDLIVPCGIRDKGVTSLQKELGRTMDMEEVKMLVKEKFSDVFGWTYL